MKWCGCSARRGSETTAVQQAADAAEAEHLRRAAEDVTAGASAELSLPRRSQHSSRYITAPPGAERINTPACRR